MTFLSFQKYFYILRLFKQWLTTVKCVVIVLINTYHLLVIQILSLKTEEKYSYYSDSSDNNIWKNCYLDKFFYFWVSPLDSTNW